MRIAYAIYAAMILFVLWHIVDFSQTASMTLLFVLWCAGLVTVVSKVRGAEWVALAGFLPVLGLLLFQLGRRLSFVFEHGGMDCATCDASPAPFLYHWTLELSLLIPGLILCHWLIRRLISRQVAHEI